LTIDDILERRLQTIVFRKGLTKTVYQARQLITHGHIAIGNKRVTVPSYIVTKTDENQMNYTPKSAIANPNHPLRQTISAPSPPERTPAQTEMETQR
jgi:small subunit ribosomal protein S4